MNVVYGSLLLVVISTAVYHLAQKTLSTQGAPFALLTVVYGVALVVCAAGWMLAPQGPRPSELLHLSNWPVLVLALAVVGIELGVYGTYRAGWAVSTLPVLVNGAVVLCLAPVAVLAFRERLGLPQLGGVACVLLGVYLLKMK